MKIIKIKKMTALLLSDHGLLKGLNSRSLHYQCADHVLKHKARYYTKLETEVTILSIYRYL